MTGSSAVTEEVVGAISRRLNVANREEYMVSVKQFTTFLIFAFWRSQNSTVDLK
jgi:hypothetical protein